MLAQSRRAPSDTARRLRKPHRGIGQRHGLRRAWIIDILKQLARLHLRIFEYLAVYDGLSGRKLEESVEGKSVAIRAAARWMAAAERGWLRIEPKGNSHLHWLTEAGRRELS